MTGHIASLSRRAIALAALLPTDNHTYLARWLYRYGTLPRGTVLERDFGAGDDVLAVLGLTSGGRARTVLDRHYETTTYPGWIGFALATAPLSAVPTCKLYVSPRPEALADAFPIIATVFDAMSVRAFKVGRGLDGLLRPDKIVAHFDSAAHLQAVAGQLGAALPGCPAQGVPFTTEFGSDGLLSWGIDPPLGAEAVSWRSWVTKRLATALLIAAPDGSDRLGAVLNQMARSGVSPSNWTIDSYGFAAEAPG